MSTLPPGGAQIGHQGAPPECNQKWPKYFYCLRVFLSVYKTPIFSNFENRMSQTWVIYIYFTKKSAPPFLWISAATLLGPYLVKQRRVSNQNQTRISGHHHLRKSLHYLIMLLFWFALLHACLPSSYLCPPGHQTCACVFVGDRGRKIEWWSKPTNETFR